MPWPSKAKVVSAIANLEENADALVESFEPFEKRDMATLAALDDASLAKLAAHPRTEKMMAWAAHAALPQDYRLAVRLFDGIVAKGNAGNLRARDALVALYAVQNDHSGLGVDPARHRRYLAFFSRFGHDDADVYLNAACCAMELGDRERALELLQLARKGKATGLKEVRKQKLFAPLLAEPRFVSLFGAKKKGTKKTAPTKRRAAKAAPKTASARKRATPKKSAAKKGARTTGAKAKRRR